MTEDYFEVKKTGGNKFNIEFTVELKDDKVVDFVKEIRDAVIDNVLETIDRYYLWHLDKNGAYVTVGEEIKAAVLALKGGDNV